MFLHAEKGLVFSRFNTVVSWPTLIQLLFVILPNLERITGATIEEN